jgi:hypothetical protein
MRRALSGITLSLWERVGVREVRGDVIATVLSKENHKKIA